MGLFDATRHHLLRALGERQDPDVPAELQAEDQALMEWLHLHDRRLDVLERLHVEDVRDSDRRVDALTRLVAQLDARVAELEARK